MSLPTARLLLRDLQIRADGSPTPLVDVRSLDLSPGTLVALVGASGAGKSLLGRALVGQVHVSPGITTGTLQVGETPPRPLLGPPLTPAAPEQLSWACQHGRDALLPWWTVARQLRHASAPAALLSALGLEPHATLDKYPHELSGGMAQRVHLAIAQADDPPWLVADEVTTGLDASAAVWVLRQLRARCDRGRGVLLISHDLDLVSTFADEVVVMDEGQVVAQGPASAWDTLDHPAARRLAVAAQRLRVGRENP